MLRSWLVPWPLNSDLTAYWTMWGTAATALATVALVIFARYAWKAALATLQGQQNSEQIAAMTAYLRALSDMERIQVATPGRFALPSIGDRVSDIQRLPLGHKAYTDSLCSEVEVRGSVWRALHRTAAGTNVEFRQAEALLIEAQEWWREPADGTNSNKEEQFKRNSKFAGELASLVLHWQTREADRKDLDRLMDSECAKFIAESPCRPTKN